ncbi:MAG: SH3 domain-containing protein [Deltaproteobacteria bacterium]|nr:SH3 domain-containing protein [Deltaproteobacteria bacterium]
MTTPWCGRNIKPSWRRVRVAGKSVTARKWQVDKGAMGAAAMRKFWCTVWVGLGLTLCLAGCQSLFPRPVYTPPAVHAPPAPPPPAPVARPTLYVTVNRLNLRACPGMDCPKIAVIDRNAEVEKVGDAADWSQIRVKLDGTIGWVSSRYLSATPVAAPPEAPPPPTPPEAVTPPPFMEKPEKPEKAKPTPSSPPSPPAVEKPPKTAKPTKPPAEEAPAPEQPVKPEKPVKPVKPEKPAPEPPVVKPAPPEKPAPPSEPGPEKPSKIRIM